MIKVYNFINTFVLIPLIRIAAIFIPKIKHFLKVRKNWKIDLQSQISLNKNFNDRDKIWFHCSSLGEFEQAKPLIQALEKENTIILSFFSASGYDNVIHQNHPYQVLYLPIDTKPNADYWLNLLKPKACIFVKNEIWPNFINQAKLKKIPLLLLSGIFNKNQIYFKWYGSLLKSSLKKFDTIYVQNKVSQLLLQGIDISSILTGDTRFDNVLEMEKSTSVPTDLKKLADKKVVVLGSSWPQEEELWYKYLNENIQNEIWTIIVPHDVSEKRINSIQVMYSNDKPILYSSIHKADLSAIGGIIIVNKIGVLRDIYKLANISFIGGGFGSGLHNILEPIAQGSPVFFGPLIQKFPEATDAIHAGIGTIVEQTQDIKSCIDLWLDNDQIKKNCKHYIHKNAGSINKVLKHINS